MKVIVPDQWMLSDCLADAQDRFHSGFIGKLEYFTQDDEWIATYHLTCGGISCREGFFGEFFDTQLQGDD